MPAEDAPPIKNKMLLPPTPGGCTSVDIVFNLGRGRLLDGSMQQVPRGYLFDKRARKAPPNVLRLKVTKRMDRTRLVILSSGEQLELVKLIFICPEEGLPGRRGLPRPMERLPRMIYKLPSQTCADDADYLLNVAPLTRNVGGVTKTFGPKDYQDALEAELGIPNPPTTTVNKYRRYFAELNLQTLPDLIPLLVQKTGGAFTTTDVTDRINDIDWAILTLKARVTERVQLFNANTAVSPAMTQDGGLVGPPKIQWLSTLQLGIIDQFFQPAVGNFDEVGFNEAYEMFANGELRFELPTWSWTFQPSSGFYFFFAEFALWAIEKNIDTARWEMLAKTLIRTQEIFARVYPPDDPPNAVLESYHPCAYDPLEVYTASEKTALVTAQPLATVNDLRMAASRNALASLPGLV